VIVSIHQPNFFAYSGVIEKIRRSDVFVVLTHAQFPRGNYVNRFNVGEAWFTMSVNQKLEPIANKRYSRPHDDWRGIKRKLPGYAEILEQFDDCIGENLVETNVKITSRICSRLGIKTKIVLDYPTSLVASERLAELCQRYGATTYLSGPSGLKYLDCAPFAACGVHVSFQEQVKPRAAIEILKEAV
jgi:hypothetical protein